MDDLGMLSVSQATRAVVGAKQRTREQERQATAKENARGTETEIDRCLGRERMGGVDA